MIYMFTYIFINFKANPVIAACCIGAATDEYVSDEIALYALIKLSLLGKIPTPNLYPPMDLSLEIPPVTIVPSDTLHKKNDVFFHHV